MIAWFRGASSPRLRKWISVSLLLPLLTFISVDVASASTAMTCSTASLSAPTGVGDFSSTNCKNSNGGTITSSNSYAVGADFTFYVKVAWSSQSYPVSIPTYSFTSTVPSTIKIAAFTNTYCPTYSSYATSNIYCAKITGTGVASWTGTMSMRASYSKSSGGTSSSSASISLIVSGAAATKLAISQQPTGAASGAALSVQPWIAVQDSTSTLVSSSTASVTVTASGGTLGGTTTAVASSGVAKFTDLTFSGVVGTSYTLLFASMGLSGVTSTSITVTPGAANKLALTRQPVLGSSGSVMATQPVVTIQDAQGNTVTSSSATVTVSIASGTSGTLSGAQASSGIAAVNGVATFTNLSFSTTSSGNTYTFRFASAGLASVDSSPGVQVSGAANKIGVYTVPILGSSGYALGQQPVIAIQDSSGNTVTSDNSTVVTVSGTGLGGTSLSATASGGFATFTGLTYTGAGSATLTFSATIGGTAKTATTSSLAVAGNASKITVSRQPQASASGTLLSTQPIVRIEDSSGQLVTSSAIVITASVVGSGGSLANSSAVTATATGGIATFTNLKLNGVVGTQYQLSFSSGSLTPATSSNISLIAGAAYRLAITIQPVGAGSGSTLATQPQVRIEDIDGNFASSSTASIVAAIYSGNGGTLGGTLTKAASAGSAAFTNLTLSGLTTETYILEFTSSGLTSVQSNGISLSAGTASPSNASISADSASLNADGTATTQITVQNRDAQGNTVDSSGGTVVLSVSGGGSLGSVTDNADGTYTATYTVGSLSGTATISGTMNGTAITDTAQISLLSTDAKLSALSVATATLSPAFSSGTTSYTSTVPFTATSVRVTPTVNESHATVTVNGSATSSASASGAINLTAGTTNTITIVVTSQSGATTTYTVVITRTAASTDSKLSALTLSSGPLSPTFAGTTTSYAASVGSAVSSLIETATANNAFATIQVKVGSASYSSQTSGTASNPLILAYGDNTVTILVTAQDNSTTTYTIVVTRALQTRTISFTSIPTSLTYGTTSSIVAAPSDGALDGTITYSAGSSTGCSVTGSTLSVTNVAGTCSVSATISAGVTYTSATTSANVTLVKATPVITWSTPLPIRSDVHLSSTQLNATSAVDGVFTYTPASGSTLSEGTVALSVSFAPRDSTNYNTASASVNLVVTGATAPNAPNAPTLTNSGVNVSSSLSITWTSTSSDGGSPVTSYQYRVAQSSSPTSFGVWTDLVAKTGATETITVGVTSRAYVAQVRACNSIGCSSASPSSGSATSTGIIVAPPVAPTSVSASLNQSSGSVSVTYSVVSGATSYSYSSDDGATWKSVVGTTGTFSFTATKGTTHKVRVRGVNASGAGTASTLTSGATVLWTTTPSVPTNLTGVASTSGDPKMNVNFDVTDGGGLSLWYEYQFGPESGDGGDEHTSYSSNVNAGSSEPFDVTLPNANGNYRVKVRACNSLGCSNFASSIRVVSSRATITTQPAGTSLTVGQGASYTLSVVARPAASESITYNWYKDNTLISGATSSTYSIPTPLVAGTYVYKVIVHAGTVDLTSNNATIVINAAPSMTTTLPGATIGLSYSYTLVPSGGTPNYTYTFGTLPSGLSYSSSYNRISGTVSSSVTPGAKTFACTITDSKGVATSATCSLSVSTPITITTTILGAASKASTYSTTLAVTGGSAPYVWSLNTGSDPLPSGFTLSSGGVLSTGSGNVPDNANSATFEVLVTDANGATDTQRLTLNVLAGIPNAPQNPAANPGDKTVTLTWTDPVSKPGVTISNFIISYVKPKGEHSDDGGHDDEERGSISVSGSTYTYVVTGLTNGLPYTFTISAKSSGGTGSPSSQVTATPLGKATPPQSVTATLSRNGISVRWKKPNENGGGSINKWRIVCTSGTEVITKDFDEGDGGEEHGDDGQNRYVVYQDSGDSSIHLIAGHSYTCTVAAKTTKNGTTTVGDPSSPTAAITFATVPDMPASVTGIYNSDTRTVTATWTASPFNGGRTITKYIAYIQQGSGEEGKRQCFTDISGITCDIKNISGKGNFVLHVVAVNEIGTSDDNTYTVSVTGKSQTLTISPISTKTIGDANFSVNATITSGLNLTYSVDPSSVNSNGDRVCSITSKDDHVSSTNGVVKILKVGTCTINVTQNGHKSDEHGDDKGEESEYGSVSGSVSFNIVDRAPSAPAVTTVASGNQTLTINWSAPSSAGGTPTGYQVAVVLASCNTDKTLCTFNESSTVATSPLSLSVTSLTNGSPYYVRVRAINGSVIGASSWAYGSSSYTPYGLPGAPSITGIVTSPETSTATITWSASASNGSAITGYTVVASPGGARCTTGGTLSCSISGLTNGVAYTFTVYGTNAAGNGPASSGSTATISKVAQTVAFNNPKPGMYGYTVGDPNVQFNASASSGLPVQWTTADSSICTVTTGGSVRLLSAGACEVIINQNGKDSLGAQTKYDVATYSSNSTQILIEPATPSAPTITSVTNSASGLRVVWTRPTRAGGSLTYTITMVGPSGNPESGCADTSTESCTATPSIKGAPYSFTVIATNAAGSSPVSNSKSGTWVVAPSAPNADGVHASVANTSDGKAIDLYWLKSSDMGGETVTRYVATATEGSNSTTCTVSRTDALDSSNYGCTITGLKANVTYSVVVSTSNSAGSSSNLVIGNIKPGLAQTLSFTSPTSSAISKYVSDADFSLLVTASSAKALTYSTTDTSYCTVNSSTGLVHLKAVGTCVVTVAQAGATNADPSQYLPVSATVTITILPVAPGAATITKITPGDGTLNIEWNPTSNNGGEATTETLTVSPSGGTCVITGHTAACTGLTNGVTYTITVNTGNSAGSTSSAPASGIPFNNVLAPMPLTAVGGVRNVTLTWAQPSQVASGMTLHHYVIEMYVGSAWQTVLTTSDSSTISTVVTQMPVTSANLQNASNYTFRASAIARDGSNADQAGELTGAVTATTLALPSAPLSVAASSTGTTITLTWQTPASDGGSSISGYALGKTYLGNTSDTSTASSARSASFSGIVPGGTYTFAVAATNAVGTGLSESVTVTALDVPGVPAITSVTPNNSNGSATIAWTAPVSGATPTSYTVVAYGPSGVTALTCSIPANTVPLVCTITGLSYKTAYTFIVYATNSAGNSANSTASSAITLHKTQTITFNTISNKSFSLGSLALTATASSGLAVAYTSTTTSVCTTSVGSSTVTFVSAGDCTITASQSGDGSDYDPASSVTQTFAVTAETPSALVLTTVDPGALKLHATWASAADLGGSTLDYYVLSWAQSADFSDEDQMTVSANNSDISSLIQEQTYRVRVQVVAKSGLSSDWSNVLVGTPYGLPAAPTLVVASQLGTGLVQVTWTNSASNGGTPIIGYTVTAYNASTGVATEFKCTAASVTCNVSGLSGSVTYYFIATATNSVGSANSLPSNNIQPGASQLITGIDSSVDHGVSPFANGASVNSGLTLAYTVSGQTGTTSAPTFNPTWGTGRSVCSIAADGTVTVDLAGVCYIQVSQNGTLEGTTGGTPSSFLPATTVTESVTVAASAPSATTGLVLSPASGHMDAVWVAPTDDGGSPIVKYILNWYVASISRPSDTDLTAARIAGNTNATNSSYGQFWITTTGTTPLPTYVDILGLTNGTTYTVEITAVNAAGKIGPLN